MSALTENETKATSIGFMSISELRKKIRIDPVAIFRTDYIYG